MPGWLCQGGCAMCAMTPTRPRNPSTSLPCAARGGRWQGRGVRLVLALLAAQLAVAAAGRRP